jgi:hypothetical protein
MELNNIDVGDRLLLRSEASKKLKDWFGEAGYLCPATLAKMACVGGGPVMMKFGRKVAYPERALFDWAKARARLVESTSDNGSNL